MVTFGQIEAMIDSGVDKNEKLYLDGNIIKVIALNIFNVDTDSTDLLNMEPDAAYAKTYEVNKFINKLDDNLEIDSDGRIYLPMIEERKRELQKIEEAIDDILKIVSTYKTGLSNMNKEELYNHIGEYFK